MSRSRRGPVAPWPREEGVAVEEWVEGISWGWRWSMGGAVVEEEGSWDWDWDCSEAVWLDGLLG